jgi:hypothetical protein
MKDVGLLGEMADLKIRKANIQCKLRVLYNVRK